LSDIIWIFAFRLFFTNLQFCVRFTHRFSAAKVNIVFEINDIKEKKKTEKYENPWLYTDIYIIFADEKRERTINSIES